MVNQALTLQRRTRAAIDWQVMQGVQTGGGFRGFPEKWGYVPPFHW
jgi:hypothetical protein